MKVLIAANVDSYRNPYVRTLYKGLLANECDVTCSIDNFWEIPLSYNIIHIQWPNLLMRGCNGDVFKLKRHIDRIKDRGIKIIVTCHNLVPHYSNNQNLIKAYDIIYNCADCIIHMAEASITLLCEKYTNLKAQHVIIPHHIYDTEYNFNISKEAARKHLALPTNKKIIVCFGAFRDEDERNLVIATAKKMKKNYVFVCPGFCGSLKMQKNILKFTKKLYEYIRIKISILSYPIITKTSFVSDEELPYYYAASDMAFIHRVSILNSGNLPMAFFAGMPVLGPNVGNVGNILEDTNNAIFNINNIANIPDIIDKIITNNDIGSRNKNIATKLWSVDVISKRTKELYLQLSGNQ